MSACTIKFRTYVKMMESNMNGACERVVSEGAAT